MAGLEFQPMGSTLSVSDVWRSDPSRLTRSVSTISLSSVWSVTNKLRGKGGTITVKQKSQHGLGFNHTVQGNSKRGCGGTSVIKVKMMRGIGRVHNVRGGPDIDKINREIDERVEKMRERFKKSRSELTKLNDESAVRAPPRRCMSEPLADVPAGEKARKDSVGTVFKQTPYWSHLLRGVYPNSLPVDELVTKEDNSPEKYIYTKSVSELEAKDRQIAPSDKMFNISGEMQSVYDTDKDTENGPVHLHPTEQRGNKDLIKAPSTEDDWGPIIIPESMGDVFEAELLDSLGEIAALGDLYTDDLERKAEASEPHRGDLRKTSPIPDFDGESPVMTETPHFQGPANGSSSKVAEAMKIDFQTITNHISESEDLSMAKERPDSVDDSTMDKLIPNDGEALGNNPSSDAESSISVGEGHGSDSELSDDSGGMSKARGRSYSVEEFVFAQSLNNKSNENWTFTVDKTWDVSHETTERLSSQSTASDIPESLSHRNDLDSEPEFGDAEEDSQDSEQEPTSMAETERHRAAHSDMYESVEDLTAL